MGGMSGRQADLAALVGSRICHDLISPIGAIGNGVELLVLARTPASPELALIAESVASANAKIRFFRIVYGAARSDHRIARNEVSGILADMTQSGRLTIDWQSPPEMARREVKLAFLLLQCLETAMPYGGRIAITTDGSRWSLHGKAERLKLDPDLWASLQAPADDRTPPATQVQFALVPEELRHQGRKLALELAEREIRLGF